MPTGVSGRAVSRPGLCMAKKGCESVASSAAFGRSRVISTTWGPTRSARPGKPRSRAQVLEVRGDGVGVERGAVVEHTPSRSVSVQTRWSGVAQAVARTPSGRSEPGPEPHQRLAHVGHDLGGHEVGGPVRREARRGR